MNFLLLCVRSPFELGVYDDSGVLLRVYGNEGKASDVVAELLDEALQTYEPTTLYYTNGPGNHTSLKVSYVSMKTVSIVKNIPLYGLNPFMFNDFSPIKALAKSYFVFDEGKITVRRFETDIESPRCQLPDCFDFQKFRTDSMPCFILPAV